MQKKNSRKANKKNVYDNDARLKRVYLYIWHLLANGRKAKGSKTQEKNIIIITDQIMKNDHTHTHSHNVNMNKCTEKLINCFCSSHSDQAFNERVSERRGYRPWRGMAWRREARKNAPHSKQ